MTSTREPDLTQLKGKRLLFYLAGLELGGAERQALYLARYLKALAADVRVWGISGSGLAAKQCEGAGIPWSIQPAVWPCRKISIPRAMWRVAGTALALRRMAPDAVLSYCERPCVAAGLAVSAQPRTRLIWCQRDTYLSGGVVERVAFRQACTVICNAHHEIRYLNKVLGKPKARMHVVHNGLELPAPIKSRMEWRAALKIPDDACVAAMVANFRFQKDHQTLVSAWREVMRLHQRQMIKPVLVLAGAPQESYPSVQGLVRELKLADSVRFPGQVQDVTGLLSACDLGVLISPSEGLSNSVLEYMASGLPVIATDIPGSREAFGNLSEGQLVPASDVDRLAASIQKMLTNSALRKELGRENKLRAELEFSMERMCAKMKQILEEVMHAPTS